MPFALLDRIKRYKEVDLYRQRRLLTGRRNIFIQYNGKDCVNFCSNDYFGLSTHPEVIKAFKRGADQYGVGSGASQLVSGRYQPHQDLEMAFADFLNRESALLFSSGYLANLGVVSALMNRKSVIFADRHNHASLVDAAQLSQAKLYRYPHNDTAYLQSAMQTVSQKNKLIISDGVFSMAGDLAPIKELARIAVAKEALFMVDDAHGMGILGERGTGIIEHCGLSQDQVPILVNPLGKALGCMGAVVSGSRTFIDTLVQFARTYIYNTALSPAVACAALASLKIIQRESWRRKKLFYLIDFFKREANKYHLTFLPSLTPIQSIIIGDNKKSLILSEALLKAGYLLSAIRPPTIPVGTTRLRIMLNCLHEETQIKELLALLAELYETPC